MDREGEWGRRGEDRGASLDFASITTGEKGRSLGGQTLYLRVKKDPLDIYSTMDTVEDVYVLNM